VETTYLKRFLEFRVAFLISDQVLRLQTLQLRDFNIFKNVGWYYNKDLGVG